VQKEIEAYLDIETTGLSPGNCVLTVAGIYLCCNENSKVVQLVGRDITADSLLCALDGVSIVHTYNGSRFDLPFVQCCLGLDISRLCAHRDLMFDCWRNNLYGGLKSVERQLGIERRLKDVNGLEAVRLWWRYVDNFDTDALEKLLEYNKEDIVNLKTLKQKLAGMCR
jgi:uncharacterized protein YprB with RNaseH-like and TPR domain